MIRDLTESLEALLKQPGLPTELGNASIRFDRPTDPYPLEQSTVNLFLFEVRENVDLRFTEPAARRTPGGTVVDQPPRRVMCTYLVTAWPVGGTDLPQQEHRLLSQVLRLLASVPTLPPAFLQGSLVGQEPPLPTVLAQPDGLKNPAEFWAAIGNRLKPSLLLSVTISMPVFPEETSPTVISGIFDINGGRMVRIAGTVTDALNAPVAGATVRVLERSRTTITNERGDFTVAAIPPGSFTLRVTSGAVTQDKAITVPAPSGGNYDVQLP